MGASTGIEAGCDRSVQAFCLCCGLDALTASRSMPLSLAVGVELHLTGAHLRRYRRAALRSSARVAGAGDARRVGIELVGLAKSGWPKIVRVENRPG